MGILNKYLVRKAIWLATPSILKILEHKGATWGPKWVTGFVSIPDREEWIDFQIGEDPEWGNPDRFFEIAGKKMAVVEREGKATSVVVATRPWRLKDGEYLYPGGATRDGISVVASGAKGRADEAISEIILSAIRMLAFLKADVKVEAHEMKI